MKRLAAITATTAVVLVLGACGSSTKGSTAKAPSPSTAVSTKPHLTQTQEVTLRQCDAPDAIGVVYAKGIVRNTSSKRSDYMIQVTVTAPDGTQIGTGGTVASNVEPGQKALWSVITDTADADWKAGTTCKVVAVERNASL